jgi:hypothetical protein
MGKKRSKRVRRADVKIGLGLRKDLSLEREGRPLSESDREVNLTRSLVLQ